MTLTYKVSFITPRGKAYECGYVYAATLRGAMIKARKVVNKDTNFTGMSILYVNQV